MLTKTNEVDKLVKQTVLDMGYSSTIHILPFPTDTAFLGSIAIF